MAIITKQRLKKFIKEGIKEALSDELTKLRALAILDVSEKEQRDIEKRYGKPSRRVGKTATVRL